MTTTPYSTPYPAPVPKMHAVHNLKAYRRARLLASEVFWITRRFPRASTHDRASTLRQAAQSIPAHIALAWSKRLHPEAFSHQLDTAREACMQVITCINTAFENHLVQTDEHTAILRRVNEIERHIQRLAY